jgi:hypothetical protein
VLIQLLQLLLHSDLQLLLQLLLPQVHCPPPLLLLSCVVAYHVASQGQGADLHPPLPPLVLLPELLLEEIELAAER